MNESAKPRRLKLRKIDAAKRQIESAIWLWFADADIVSVHTLTIATHRILRELSELWGVTPLPLTAKYLLNGQGKKPKPPCEEAESFFRQAKNDETYELNETVTELYLFDAVMAYINLLDNDAASALMSTFVVRFGVQRPELFAPGTFSILEKKVGKTFNLERLEKLSKLEFLKEFFGVLGRPSEPAIAIPAI